MNISDSSRRFLSRAKKARVIHCPGLPYYGEHIAVLMVDGADRPGFLTGPDGALVLFATPLQADDALHALAPDLELAVDAFATRAPAQILP